MEKDTDQDKELRVAVLIDAENISSKYAGIILQEAESLGNVIYKRIYGNWTTTQLNSWKHVMLENAIQPVQQYSNTVGKNSSDSALIIDAMDLLYQHRLDAFCIVSSDSDFTRLASRLRESEMFVLGMGEKKTPRSFISACNKFSYLDLLYKAAQESSNKNKAKTKAKSTKTKDECANKQKDERADNRSEELAEEHTNTKERADERTEERAEEHAEEQRFGREEERIDERIDERADERADERTSSKNENESYGKGSDITVVTNTLREITEECSGDDGWIISSRLGARLNKRLPDFDTRNFGFKKFVPFVESLGIFESKSIQAQEDPNVKMIYFRLIEE